MENSSFVIYEYFNGDNFVFSYTQITYKKDGKYFDNETARMKEINIDDDQFLLVEYDGNPEKILLWDDKMYIYKIVFEGDDLDEMVKIAQSIE